MSEKINSINTEKCLGVENNHPSSLIEITTVLLPNYNEKSLGRVANFFLFLVSLEGFSGIFVSNFNGM
jgi:hypothetical protein